MLLTQRPTTTHALLIGTVAFWRANPLHRLRNYVSIGAIQRLILRPHLFARLPAYSRQLIRYRRLEAATSGTVAALRIYPCLEDAHSIQEVTGNYFYQDCWAARQVFREQPQFLVDVGSTTLLVGILSQFIPAISVDIRPIQAHLTGLTIRSGSVLNLPFADAEVPCLTTMCVLEHIGLGRYGDPLNPTGTEEAVTEIARVVAPGGVVVYSVPVGQPRLEFNANRRFSREHALGLFQGWEIVDSCVLTPEPTQTITDSALATIPDPVVCVCVRKPIPRRD